MRRLELLSLLFAVCCSAGCRGDGDAPERETVVRTVVVGSSVISRTVVVPCRLEGADEAVISVSTPATVTGVFVAEGDHVEDGDLLVSLETDGMHAAEIETASARLSAARAARDYAAGNLDRMESLFESGAVTASQYESAESAAMSSEAAAGLAETGYGSALSEASVGQVRAPFTATVSRVWARPGNPAAGNIVALTGGDVLEASLRIPPARMRDLEEGLPVFLQTTHFPGEIFEGVLTAVSPSVDPVSGLVSATAQFSGHDGRLRPGMSATATVALKTESEAIVIPQSAMRRNPDGSFTIVVVEDGVARFRPIETGIQEGFRWQVLSGLSAGDSLVVMGVNTVTEGCRVREAGI